MTPNPPTSPTVEKWEEIADLWRYARKPPTAGGAVDMKMPKQIFIERVIDLIALSVQEAKAEDEDKLIKIKRLAEMYSDKKPVCDKCGHRLPHDDMAEWVLNFLSTLNTKAFLKQEEEV